MRKRIRIKTRFYIIVFIILSICFTVWFIQKANKDKAIEPVELVLYNPDNETIDSIESSENEDTLIEEEIFRVCLDAGHGGHDSGTESILGFYEKDINLSVVLKAGELLEKEGYGVIYTRTSDKALGSDQKEDLSARCAVSNEAEADIFISVHCNFDKVSKKTKGTEVWCRFEGNDGERLAKCLSDKFSLIGFTRNRGIKYEDEGALYVLKHTDAPAALIELGFLSNTEDSNFLNSDKGLNSCAKAILEAVKEYEGQAEQ